MAFGGVPCVNVGAPAGHMTWGQMHSDAGIDLSQSILFLLMSQQQHPLSAGGGAGGAARAEAPNTISAETAANESVFMMLCFFSFAFSVIDLLVWVFCMSLVSFAQAAARRLLFSPSVTCKGDQMSQNQRQSGATNTRFCLGRKCGDLVCARGKTQTRADFCTRKSQEKAEK